MIAGCARLQHGTLNNCMSILSLNSSTSPFLPHQSAFRGGSTSQTWSKKETSVLKRLSNNKLSRVSLVPKCTTNGTVEESPSPPKAPFGYTRKDVLLIGIGVTVFGVALKSGLEFAGVDPLQAGNVVQLVVVLGMTIGWISTYMFRVASKDMTYAQQLRDYESKVMEKRLEGLTEAELQVLLEQVEEEKRLSNSEQTN